MKSFLVFTFLSIGAQVGANATPVVFVCNYPNFSDGKGIHKDRPFELGFLVKEPKDEKGTVFGNNGSETVSIVKNDEGGLTFVEFTQTGAIQVTAIDSNLKSVHSRHTIIGGNLVPTQYYGKCQRKEKASQHFTPYK